MKRFSSILLLSLICACGASRAEICSLDTVPAATLLLPFFDVDLADPEGRTTLMSIANASDRATLARVTLWTDAGLPTLAFDVYLTGYDVQTLNLRDLLQGRLPVTADPSRDPADELSPRGAESLDTHFPQCENLLPLPAVPPHVIDFFQKAHLGQSSPSFFGGLCLGFPTDGKMARGYATVDVVRRCSLLFPTDPGYFGPDVVAAHDNVLWGEFFYVEPGQRFAQGENMVRVESDPSRFGPGDRTFYGRYVNQSGIDGREPLPTKWGVRYLTGGLFAAGTDLIVWVQPPLRTPAVPDRPFRCDGGKPAWYPLVQEDFLVFDEEEQLERSGTFVEPPPARTHPFSLAGRYSAVRDIGVPFDFGWIFLDFQPSPQAWVGSVASASGLFSAGVEGAPFQGSCEPSNQN